MRFWSPETFFTRSISLSRNSRNHLPDTPPSFNLRKKLRPPFIWHSKWWNFLSMICLLDVLDLQSRPQGAVFFHPLLSRWNWIPSPFAMPFVPVPKGKHGSRWAGQQFESFDWDIICSFISVERATSISTSWTSVMVMVGVINPPGSFFRSSLLKS